MEMECQFIQNLSTALLVKRSTQDLPGILVSRHADATCKYYDELIYVIYLNFGKDRCLVKDARSTQH